MLTDEVKKKLISENADKITNEAELKRMLSIFVPKTRLDDAAKAVTAFVEENRRQVRFLCEASYQVDITEMVEGELHGLKEELKTNWTGKLVGTFKIDTGGVVATVKAPKEGFGVIFENKIDYAIKQYLLDKGSKVKE